MQEKRRLSTSEIIRPLYEARKWMRFLGIMSIGGSIILIFITAWQVLGGSDFMKLTRFISAVVGIWQGTLLISASTATEVAYREDDDYAMVAALARLRNLIKIFGYLAILEIILIVTVLAIGLTNR